MRRYLCPRASEPFPIDGDLTKTVWDAAPWTDDFVDIEGEAKPMPRHRTRAKMMWDDRAFYIAAELEEPHIWATLTEHDSVIFRDNDFEVFIDPDGDSHLYAELEINAFNTTWDLLLVRPYRDGGPPINSWEIKGLETAVRIDGTINDPSDEDRGWTVEIAIPWESLGELTRQAIPPQEGDVWRVNFSRVQWRTEVVDGRYEKVPNVAEDNWVWSPQGVIDMHRPEMWGVVEFTSQPLKDREARLLEGAEERAALMRVYHAQRAYRHALERWADTLEELMIEVPGVDLRTSGNQWYARIGRYAIDHESRITVR